MSDPQEHLVLMAVARALVLLSGVLCLAFCVPQIFGEPSSASLKLWFGVILGLGLCISSIFEKPAGVLVTFILLVTP
jgi:hypothetical protein